MMIESTSSGEWIVQGILTSSMFTQTTVEMYSSEKSTTEVSIFAPTSDKPIHWFTTTNSGRSSSFGFSVQKILVLETESIRTTGSSSQKLNSSGKNVGFNFLTTNVRKMSRPVSTKASVFKQTDYESMADVEYKRNGKSMNDGMSESVLTTFQLLDGSSPLLSLPVESEIAVPISYPTMVSVSFKLIIIIRLVDNMGLFSRPLLLKLISLRYLSMGHPRLSVTWTWSQLWKSLKKWNGCPLILK